MFDDDVGIHPHRAISSIASNSNRQGVWDVRSAARRSHCRNFPGVPVKIFLGKRRPNDRLGQSHAGRAPAFLVDHFGKAVTKRGRARYRPGEQNLSPACLHYFTLLRREKDQASAVVWFVETSSIGQIGSVKRG